MNALKKNIIKAAAAALALCVAGTSLYLNLNKPPKIIDHKMPDYFELSDRSSIGFDGEYFIKLAFLNSSEEFLEYTDLIDDDNNVITSDVPENTDSSDCNDSEFTSSESNDEYENNAPEDNSEPDNDNNADTTYPAENNTVTFEINEFDMLMKYNGTDEAVVIPENVREIAGYAFDGNEYVQRIILHTTIESLLIDAFVGCPNLCEICYEGSSAEWESVYKAPGVIPYNVDVTFTAESDITEETASETTAPVEETTEDTTAETTAPVDETTEETTVETTTPADETAEDTTSETTAPADETTEETTSETTTPVEETTEETTSETTAPADETTEETTSETTVPVDEATEETTSETTAPVEETTEETTSETTAPADETTEETTSETTAPVDETTEDSTSETTAPADETTEETTSETTAPVEETTEETTSETSAPADETTEDTTSETTVPVEETTEETTSETTAPVDEATEETTAETTAPVEETTEKTTTETTAPADEAMEVATSETTAPVDETTEETTSETTAPVEETAEIKESKTVSLVSQLTGISGVKTKIAARMSYFPTSSVITITNTDAAALYAESALQLLDTDVISYYAFDISVFDADTSEKIHALGGDVTFNIGVPDILADYSDIKVYHIDSGYPELLESEIVTNNDGVRTVEFSASDFSPFVFTAEADRIEVTTTTAAAETTEPEETTSTEISDENMNEVEETTEDENTENTTSDYADDEAIIKVTFPASASYIINPYHLDVKVGDGATSNAAIISPEMKITSESNCKVAVYMSAVAQNVPDTVRLSETYLTKGESEKSLFLYVEAAGDNNTYKNYYDGSANQIVVSRNGGQSQKILELDEPEEGSYTEGTFRIFGDTFMPEYDPWRENENVSILMVFKVESVNDEG